MADDSVKHYAKLDLWMVHVGAWLVVGLNPERAKEPTDYMKRRAHEKLMELVNTALVAGKLRPAVSPPEFLAWCEGRVDVPPQLSEAVEQWHGCIKTREGRIAELEAESAALRTRVRELEAASAPSRWPWGDFETPLLSELKGAVERWLTPYIASGNPDELPYVRDIEDDLIKRDVPKENAAVLARMLNARTGRGPKKEKS